MTPARLQTIEEIFYAALEKQADEVDVFLDTACEGDELLRRKVERLLASYQRAGSFIETPAAGIAPGIIGNRRADLLVGQTIGHYKICESIGTGGMGEVYLATDVVAGRKAALKLLPMRFTGDAARLKRFQQEAHTVVGLNHPNILTVYEIGEDHSIHYIASELIEGETLREHLKRGPMQLSEAVDVAIQVANALAAAHQAGIVHRDIKPENIMLRPDGYVKVLDFGIAKLAEEELPATMPRDEALLLVETNLGAVLGTVRYMSPEQACGGHVDKRTDIWSLGVVLYEMLTGHAPFTGDTPQDVMFSILEKEPPPLTRYIARAPGELQQIISKTLRKDREERYHNAHELLEALKDLRRKLEFEAELERSTAAAQAELKMAAETAKQMALEIGHVLFVDIVSYSQLSINEQHAAIAELTQTVRSTEQFRKAGGADRLIKIATGDGMALVFYTSPEAPVRCAMEISRALKQHPRLHIRMGIHSGPVSSVTDVTGRTNLAGAGLNLAQRVMECGDAGHILLSKHVAEDMSEFEQWRPLLHDLGTCEVKHGLRIGVVNLWSDDVGNREAPQKFRALRKRTRVRWAEAAAALLLSAAIAAAFVVVSRKSSTAISPVSNKSVAVLPLENLSEEKENAFFADGIQDELLSNLSKIKDLKVISRTSVMQYKSGITRNLKEIAQQLGVSNVVEGSVRRSGNRIRVSVQLIDAQTDRHIWVQNYDRTLVDSITLQDELATEIAGALGATLSTREKARVEAKPTNNPAAYDAYLRGRAFPVASSFGKSTAEGAIRSFEEAVKLDPSFALAWASLSYAQSGSYWLGFDPSPARLAAAKDAADRALALDPNLPETHLALGYYRYYGQRDYTGGLAEFQQAEKGLPNNVDVIEAIGFIQRRLGHWDEAIVALRRAIELDPRDINAYNNLALTYSALRRFPEALAAVDRALAFEPANAKALGIKATAFWATGDLQAVERLLANLGTEPLMPRSSTVPVRGVQALFQRRYAAAIEILSSAVVAKTKRGEPSADEKLFLALSQQRAGDVAGARATYQEAAQNIQRELEKIAPDSYQAAWRHTALGWAYAGLGEAASAIAEGQKAMAILPTSKDPFEGPEEEDKMARIYALLGEADQAIPILNRLLEMPNGRITSALLRLDPVWDQIRNDPRFEKILEESKNPVTLTTTLPPQKSIAVLPFENLSKDEENAFFAGGVQDEILTDLAKVADLKVISRTSVMKYKSDLERNLREIAKTLGVSHVVEGSVQRAGGRVRVNVQLIDARNDAHIWAEHYDRDVADVFAVQTEIARQIANQLKANLSPAEKAAIAERPTADPVAYAYYTRARQIDIYSNWGGAENEKAAKQKVELLEKATQRDPSFALAYCKLAKAQMDVGNFELAKKAVDTALRLRPDLAEGHLALARYYWLAPDSILGVDREAAYDRARDELAIVRRMSPNNAEALLIDATIGRHQNRWDASLANLQKASELDPSNGEVAYRLEQIYFEMRRYSELEQFIKKQAASGGPRTGPLEDPFNWLPMMKLAQGDPVAAQSLLDQVPPEYDPGGWIWDVRFKAALYLRDYDAANRVIAANPANSAETGSGETGSDWAHGLVARARGDKQKALAAFAAARQKMEAQQGDKPKDADYFADVAKLHAGLGRKEEAIREALRAVELMPIAKDSLNGPALVANLALVYGWTGERDRALEQLEKVATIPGSPELPTYGDLRFNPCWDSLRGDKRFDKIVAAAKAASR